MLAERNTPGAVGPRKQLFEMLQSYVKPQLIYVAAKLGLADCLAEGPRSFEELTGWVEAEPQALQRLLRGLINIGLLYNTEAGDYGLTALGSCLATDAPHSLRQVAILQGEEIFRAWGNLLYSVQTGRPAFEQALGCEFFSYFADNPEAGARFNYFMSNTGQLAARALREAYDFRSFRRLVDVGGGDGLILATLLAANPYLTGVLLDASAETGYLEKAGVLERCEVVRGDFFAGVPAGGDVYLLSQIIHDWDDERAGQILQNCRRVMQPGQKLLLFEQVMPEQPSPAHPTVALDLVMLVLTGGRERTTVEFATLLEANGFSLRRIIPTRHDRSLLEAEPI